MSKTRNNMRSSEEHSSLSSCTSSSLSSDEEIDTRDLKPIKNYLTNRKELARQLFKSVKLEKIRMMLPQVLKHVDFNELEEYCVNELNGMSKARILSKLNGKPMLESSDTSETDDSGPSLEIISDTEEWLTDDDISKKENSKQGKLIKKDKIKRKTHIKKKNTDTSNSKAKCSIKSENSDKNIKIKREDDKDKGKEGDSLLDLLELEMRARAIRALIRKEEDVMPSTNPSETSNGQTTENNIGTSQDDDKAKETCRKQLEKIINAQQGTKGEDEDVVLVIQPTPVVELLSSDSDGEVHDETRVNQKKNERATGKSANTSDENMKNSNKTLGTQVTGTHTTYSNTNILTKTDLSSETRTIMPDRNVDIKNNTLSISISADNVAERRKKSKKKSHSKSQLTSSASENISNTKQIYTTEIIEQSNNLKNDTIDNTTEQLSFSDENEVMEEKNNTKEEASKEEISKESRIEEERLTELDEVIDLDDLDDYCDVMDIENCDEDKSEDEVIIPFSEEHKQSAPETTLSKSDSTETWASRYYQTDDVQNVIKESKIQSEIRKRLRERQRLSKLNKSPNLNLPSQSSTDTAATSEKVPTGSVEEYLALKRAMNANVSPNSNNANVSTNSNNNTTQDNPFEVISSDSNIKEMSVQDENISSNQDKTDGTNDAQKAAENSEKITSEITEPTEATESTESMTEIDTKHDSQPD
ncbi:TNF receptor-associated factor family protein DDB_G0272098 [Nylanderia fulva]|uniref:TNF receptor-associated factor family protein DDB_G0272098 n=1 Tax=Nylanderia fulva TaxID=613905 RepID=UPI0010FB15E1|nr:TNF receptor-associated factor family protein DDB_G0272098 [Nylanderia fulva]XP_029176624.1 TNF receptor-associated factor family protein DDB_G0272098 [Nylanderia fulva]XP_029176625.1 TNF receptor-associated factor family protein DDB_G0272098 [Nylanderia fulva]XP_029176626.1 TNF receptor-associated factor family protein DDB_G0272098 [Nylanderia fulva]XP_029176627.1 TNF receptor-associated factor family protein DDB_G0272098 [Nylanderia fulva]